MRQDEELEALANHHEHVSKCIRVTMIVLGEARQKKAQGKFGYNVRKALKAKKGAGEGDELMKMKNGVRMKVSTVAVLKLVHSASKPVPMQDVRAMLLKEFNKGKAGQAVRVLVNLKYLKKTSDGLVPGIHADEAVAS